MAAPAVSSLTVGSPVWVEDDGEAWLEGTVLSVDGDGKKIKIKKSNGSEVTVSSAQSHPKDLDALNGGVDDMTKLAYLHEPGVLENLKSRYSLDEIYTYTGSILIAVNPFAKLPHLYDDHMMEQYKGVRLGELSPHVFAIAESAFRAMIDEGKSQSVLVSGESGAGKTETTKLIMQYLAYMGGRASTDGRTVESQVLESNPLLEAFGNAKTVRNNNSSRFGKFVEIQFDRNGRISGAAVRTYLLERSRVVQISDPERNYHCFYQLCSGATPEEREKYKLLPADQFHYLNQSTCFDLPGYDNNAEEYVKTRRAMDIVGLSPEEQEAIFRVVASILHIGNIEFAPGKEPDSSKLKDKKSKMHLEAAAELLCCDPKQMETCLVTRTLVTRDGNILKDLDTTAAVVSRDTIAKTIYAKLFDWLVDKVNKSIGQDPSSKVLIGVLDIYGFESFKINSFEQFCINLANEKLQQHFNQHVFKAEQEEYEKEEINWSYIEFVDNQDVLELIEKKPMGIISLLDEQCMFPKSNHETFATKLIQTLGKHKRFSKPKLSQFDFTIDHYAGKVTYQTNLFLDKNKDYVVAEHQSLLGNSRDPFVAGLFPSPQGGKETKTKFTSLGSSFKQQLADLMTTLNTTEPHYIRCVKPNSFNRSGLFENKNVLQQLRCGGVLEAVRISCAGYPTRKTFDEFLDRFAILAPDLTDGSVDDRTGVQKLLERFKFENYQIGKSKVFLRAGQMAELDALRAEKLSEAAKKIQLSIRAFLQWRAYTKLRTAAIHAQARWRGIRARKDYTSLRRNLAAVKIQKHVRRFLAQQSFREAKRAAIVIQSGARGMFARKKCRHLRRTRAATKIQSKHRQFCARRAYLSLRGASVRLQCHWRARSARLELKKLKFESRQTGALQEAKTKLEKQCEELQWRLQVEKRMRADVEDQKEKEISRLQAALEEANTKLEDSKSVLEEKTKELSALSRQLAEIPLNIINVAPGAPLPAGADKENSRDEGKEHLEGAASASAGGTGAATGGATAATAAGPFSPPPPSSLSPGSSHLLSVTPSKPPFGSPSGAPGHLLLSRSASSSPVAAARAHSVDVREMSRLVAGVTAPSNLGHGSFVPDPALVQKTEELELENLKLKKLLEDSDSRAAQLEAQVGEEQDIRRKESEDLKSQYAKISEAFARMEEQMKNLEQENQVLRQQALPLTPQKSLSRLSSAGAAAASSLLFQRHLQQQNLSHAGENGLVPHTPASGAVVSGAGAGFSLAEARALALDSPTTAVDAQQSELEMKRQKLLIDRQQNDQQALLDVILLDLGYHNSRPVGACIIYRCLFHWRSFEAERTNVFERIIQTIGTAIESQDNSNEKLCYWLSNTSTLLFLLQKTLKASGAAGGPQQRRRTSGLATPTLLGRGAALWHQTFRGGSPQQPPSSSQAALSSSHSSGEGVLRPVDAKYPALLFKQQLTAYVEKIYGTIRDNTKKAIGPTLGLCIQAPRASRTSGGRQTLRSSAGSSRTGSVRNQGAQTESGSQPPQPENAGSSGSSLIGSIVGRDTSSSSSLSSSPSSTAPTASSSSSGTQALGSHWGSIIFSLSSLLKLMRENFVPPFLVKRLLMQIFSFINVQLFNSLLLRRECCSFSNGEYVKAGLTELEHWILEAGEAYSGNAWDELKFIRQAVGFLVIHQKPKKTLAEITNDLCPVLSIQQLYRISTMYWDDKYGTHSVNAEVVASMRAKMTDESNANANSSFLLDDDSSIPFSVDDICRNMAADASGFAASIAIDLHKVPPPQPLRDNSSFHFLLTARD